MIPRVLAAFLFGLAAPMTVAHAQATSERAQAVVELYTSQGCTQCPRANRLLGMFAREEGVLALTIPVGIWDYLGWNDTFARPEFGERQRNYARALRVRGRFTPQLVINGERTMSASDWDGARATLDQERAEDPPLDRTEVSITRLPNGRSRLTLGADARGAGADVWLVAFDPGPVSVVITRGLNINRTVTHYNLARSLERVAVWDGRPMWLERGRCTPQCAVIVQSPNGGPILGAAFTLGQASR